MDTDLALAFLVLQRFLASLDHPSTVLPVFVKEPSPDAEDPAPNPFENPKSKDWKAFTQWLKSQDDTF